MTDALLKELDKLESLFSLSPTGAKAKSPAIGQSVDALLEQLQQAKLAIELGDAPRTVFSTLGKNIDTQKKQIDERQKELHNSLLRFGKTADKKFVNPLPVSPPLFDSPDGIAALQRVIGMHFVRTGSSDIADVFYQECGLEQPTQAKRDFENMHRILGALRLGDIEPALQWAIANRTWLSQRHSTFEFDLHRSAFMRLVTQPPVPSFSTRLPPAIEYSRKYFPGLYESHPRMVPQINRLLASILSASHLDTSPYADLAQSSIHTDLESAFVKEYCAKLEISRQPPLSVVGDIGGNGALAKIEKSKKIMKDKRDQWEVGDELMIEIPLPPQNRYHSIFACPVSKEQSTDKNPPNMLTCGHVIAKESVIRLTKGGGRIKCPYCPVESTGSPLQVHF